jgi:hypothetical protein
MSHRHILCAVLVALIGFGCGSSRSRAISLAHEAGINELRNDLIAAVSGGEKQHELPQATWPESVQRFQPLSVQRHTGGILIVIIQADREQEGLLIMLDPKDDPGSGGSGVSYERIRSEGVFWCVEKVRAPWRQRTNE